MEPICVFPDCEKDARKGPWCVEHWGLFPHKCTEPGCDRKVLYDDEPKCFTHSPDEGSSVRGYSAHAEANK